MLHDEQDEQIQFNSLTPFFFYVTMNENKRK